MKKLIFFTILAIVFTIGVFTVVAVNNRGNQPVAFWKFDEGYGPTAFDAAGANDGTITNAAWKNEPECKSGKCLWFDGDGDYVQIDNTAFSATKSTTGSISAWFKWTSGTSGPIFVYSDGDAADGFMMIDIGNVTGSYSDESIRFGYRDTIDRIDFYNRQGHTFYRDSKWHHVVVTVGSSSNALYVDGIQLSGTYAVGNANTGGYFTQYANFDTPSIGGRKYNNAWNYFFPGGFIDDVRIYNYARSPAQIRAEFVAGKAARGAAIVGTSRDLSLQQSQGLLGHWKMDETSWTVDCSTDTVMDSSGNAKHGDACPNAGGLAPAAGKYGNAGLFDGTEDYVAVPDIDF